MVNLASPILHALSDEQYLVVAQGMEYVHNPLAWESPTAEDLEHFFAVMGQNNSRKVFVHCVMNMRVSFSFTVRYDWECRWRMHDKAC